VGSDDTACYALRFQLIRLIGAARVFLPPGVGPGKTDQFFFEYSDSIGPKGRVAGLLLRICAEPTPVPFQRTKLERFPTLRPYAGQGLPTMLLLHGIAQPEAVPRTAKYKDALNFGQARTLLDRAA